METEYFSGIVIEPVGEVLKLSGGNFGKICPFRVAAADHAGLPLGGSFFP